MNKKIILISGLGIIVVALLIMMSRKETPPVLKTTENKMPDFRFQLIDGGSIQASDMDADKYTLLWFFDSECNLCANEIHSLTDSISLLNNCQIVLLSYEDSIKVAEFNERFRLMDFPSMHVVYTSEESVFSMFKIYAIPTLCVYHPDRRLIKYKPGPVTIQEIVDYLK